jgi:hypothetical protein
MKKFVALGTECAGYLKVAKASEGTIFRYPVIIFLLCFFFYYLPDILYLALQLL